MADGFPVGASVPSFLFAVLRVAMVWSTLFFVFYIGATRLNKKTRFLAYASEALMPFYVLHQPVIIIIAYMIFTLHLPVPAKLVGLAGASFIVIMTVYHFAVRKVNGLRLLFGLPKR